MPHMVPATGHPLYQNRAQQYLAYSEEVSAARIANRPIVALETTIITHGMPYPENLETAFEVEEIVRQHGAVPATIGIFDGKIKIGMEPAEIEMMAQAEQVIKVSRRDLPYVIAHKRTGATTVAATMYCAALANIPVFVTGGIGGVHRGAELTFDISADLQELAQTQVAVVCAGAKAILDLPLTLEYLETHGVPVISVGQKEFPAFYCRESGLNADYQLNHADEIAHFISTQWALGMKSGVVIANPIQEDYAMPKNEIDAYIAQAIQEADEQMIKGKNVTPYLLNRVKQLSFGKSLVCNIALIKNNARLGAEIARVFHQS